MTKLVIETIANQRTGNTARAIVSVQVLSTLGVSLREILLYTEDLPKGSVTANYHTDGTCRAIWKARPPYQPAAVEGWSCIESALNALEKELQTIYGADRPWSSPFAIEAIESIIPY
jgi:hypothetical protein